MRLDYILLLPFDCLNTDAQEFRVSLLLVRYARLLFTDLQFQPFVDRETMSSTAKRTGSGVCFCGGSWSGSGTVSGTIS